MEHDELGTCRCCGHDEMELMDCEHHEQCGSYDYCYVCLNHCDEWQISFCDRCADDETDDESAENNEDE